MKEVEDTIVNTNNEQYMQEQGVTEGSVAKVTHEAMVENLRNDVESYTKALENAKADLENYAEQYNLDKELWDMLEAPGAINKIVPDRFYEQNPRYWEIAAKKQFYDNREKRAVGEGQLKQREDRVKHVTEALERAKEKLKKFEVM